MSLLCVTPRGAAGSVGIRCGCGICVPGESIRGMNISECVCVCLSRGACVSQGCGICVFGNSVRAVYCVHVCVVACVCGCVSL